MLQGISANRQHGRSLYTIKQHAALFEALLESLNGGIEAGLEEHFRSKPVKIADAGHYLQEDAHEQFVPALVEFLGR